MAGMKFDRARAEAAVRELLEALGLDPTHKDLQDTPERVATAYGEELLRGYHNDPQEIIRQGSETLSAPCPDPVVLSGIDVVTVCPHHLLVSEGSATVAYLPGARILGLGTVVRLVDSISRRLTLQERIAGEVADALMHEAGARGAFCQIELRHGCLRSRGPEAHRTDVMTWAARGELQQGSWPELLLQQARKKSG